MASGSAIAARVHPLAGREGRSSRVTLTPAEPAQRVALRARPDAVAAVSAALGVNLPGKPKTSSQAGARGVLWLGPDEWLVLEEGERDVFGDLRHLADLHSTVDVSHRNTAILVEGEGAEAALNAGCPQDLRLESFPVGACSRTILGKVEVVLWRTAETAFRVECWRSFSDYVFSFLEEAIRDTAP